MTILYIILLLAACAALVKGADFVIKALTYLARYWRISEFVVSFVLAGLITSLPELFVGVTSALHKTPTLSLGNVIGANIADICWIVGLTAILIRGFKTESKVLQKNVLYMVLVTICPLLMLLDGVLSRIDGALLLVVFALYNIILFYQSERYKKAINHALRRDLLRNLSLLFLGIIVLLGSAEAIVRISQQVALALNVPVFLLGLFLVAIGTTLPELVFSVRSVFQGRKEMVLGNILGSLVTNSALILGLVALIYPIKIFNPNLFLASAGFMLIGILFFWLFIRSRRELSWQEGIGLVFFYILFVAVEFWVKKG